MGKYLLMVQWLLPGGTETYTLTLAKVLVRSGHQVGLFTAGGPFASQFRQVGVRLHVHKAFANPASPNSVTALQDVLRRFGYQVIHAHDSAGFHMLPRVAARRRIMTVHGTYSSQQEIRAAGQAADAVIAVSPVIKSYLTTTCNLSQARVHLVPNGISTVSFHPRRHGNLRKRLGIPKGAMVVGYAGRFTLEKARVSEQVCQAIAEWARQHADVHVIIAGRMSRQRLQHNLGPRVHVLGTFHDMPKFYRTCNVVVGTARVALEAMVSEVPTIGVGESRYIGRLTSHNIAKAYRTNFGDHGRTYTWTASRLHGDLDYVRGHPHSVRDQARKVRGLVRRTFSNHRVVKRILHLYN